MVRKLRFNPAIPDDLTAALKYYDEIAPELGDRFRSEVDRRLDDISAHPEAFPMDVPPIQFAKIHRFPYLIFFKVTSNFVNAIAIVHGSSQPETWRSRNQEA